MPFLAKSTQMPWAFLSRTGKIVVSIPWTSLYAMPVVISVEDVYVLAAPLSDGGYDPKRDAALQNAIKRKKLSDLEQPQVGHPGKFSFRLWTVS